MQRKPWAADRVGDRAAGEHAAVEAVIDKLGGMAPRAVPTAWREAKLYPAAAASGRRMAGQMPAWQSGRHGG